MSKYLIIIVFSLLANLNFAQEKLNISGYVKDANTGEELIGAAVYVEEIKSGAVTNVYGYYVVSLVPGEYNISFSFLGKETETKKIQLSDNIKLNIELKDNSLELKVVEVTGERLDQNVTSNEMSVEKLDIEKVKQIPAFMGEVDVLKTITLLPGVQSGGDASTGFFVRGGGADQNLILLDEAPVYNASHLLNFFSVFNPDAIKDLKLYKGGIPSRYGGRLSSVLDIRMNEGNKKEFKGQGGIGLISSRLTLEGPFQKGKGSFLISGRRTYADFLFFRFANDEAQRDNTLYFYDLNAKLNYVINEKNRIFLSGYFGRDVTGFADVFGFNWGNTTGTFRWTHLFSDRLFSNFSLIYSKYDFLLGADLSNASFSWKNFITNYNAKADFTFYLNSKNTLNFGYNTILHQVDPGTFKFRLEGAIDNTINLTAFNGLEHGIYLSNEQDFNGRLSATYGARLSVFQRVGPGKNYTYDKSNFDAWQATDTSEIKGIGSTFLNLEPRLSVKYLIDETSSIKASYNRMAQYIQQVQSTQSVIPFDIWFMAGANVAPMLVDQIAAGYFRNFRNNMIETSVEVFYKDYQNINDLIGNGQILGNEFFESQIRAGVGEAYGLEVLLKKAKGDFSGWISYTYAISELQIPGINNGNKYFSNYDRRHDVSVVSSYQVKSHINISANFLFQSGRAVTFPIGGGSIAGTTFPIYADRNASRLPNYHRADISVTLDPNPAKAKNQNKKVISSWNFSIFNVYGRINPFSVTFTEDEQGKPITEVFYIPGPIPSVTWNFKF